MESNWQNGHSGASAPGVQPEILPPLEGDAGGRSPAPPSARSRGRWAVAPATYFLVGINIAVFLLMAFSGVSTTSPTALQLLQWGADNGGLVLEFGEWWRLVTSTFVHVGVIHLATNMWCLWNLGLLGEPLLGPAGTIAVYLLTGVAGNLLSVAVNPDLPGGSHSVVGAGSSGAVFGLAGVLIVLLKSKLLPVPGYELKRLRKSVIYFAVLNFVLGASTLLVPSLIRIDNMAHLGGFLSGLALGVPLVPRIGAVRADFIRRQWIAFLGMIFLLALVAYGVSVSPGRLSLGFNPAEKATPRVWSRGVAVSWCRSCLVQRTAVVANFLTMASSSFRSLSLRFVEYRRIWVRNRSSSSVSFWLLISRPRVSSAKNCARGRSSALAILASVSSEGTVCPFSTRDK